MLYTHGRRTQRLYADMDTWRNQAIIHAFVESKLSKRSFPWFAVIVCMEFLKPDVGDVIYFIQEWIKIHIPFKNEII